MSAEVEAAAIASLDAEDPQLVAHAAEALGEYGSAGAEKALWRRLEKWHAEMQSPGELDKQENLERALKNALSNGLVWLLDFEKLKRLRDLCLTETIRDEMDQMIEAWNHDISVQSLADEEYSINVAHYRLKTLDALKQKLLQFPKGTLFKWTTGPDELFEEFKTYLEEHGMKLEREPALLQNSR